ncbi:MAG: sensor histidine kinase [Deltaproteobacteria bacterium]|nr:sensor histidine kinase [Deltaproteobacteria bacterium]
MAGGTLVPDGLPATAVGTEWNATLRTKLAAAFLALVLVGAASGLVSVLSLKDLERVYLAEQVEVKAHEEIHEGRIHTLKLLQLPDVREAELSPESRNHTAATVDGLRALAHRCDACHAGLAERSGLTAQLHALRRAGDRPAGSVPAVESAVARLEENFGALEERFHALLERHHAGGALRLHPTAPQQVGIVALGVLVALLLAAVMARSFTRSIFPLILAARRLGKGSAVSVQIPADPDLAPVAEALNEMAVLVARRVRDDVTHQLLQRAIDSQEEERKRVARDLHDGLGQSLSALLLELPARAGADAPALEARVRGLMDDVRRMAWDLRPSLLDDYGLTSALERYVEDVSRRSGLAIHFQAAAETGRGTARLAPGVETVLFRVAQEALHNVVRHAGAQHASVVLVRRDGQVLLLVEDDGRGFDPDAARRSAGSLGLLGMEERLALVGGVLTVDSVAGRGTTVRASIPVPAGTA